MIRESGDNIHTLPEEVMPQQPKMTKTVLAERDDGYCLLGTGIDLVRGHLIEMSSESREGRDLVAFNCTSSWRSMVVTR